jgi:hypothetical protein
MFFLKVNIQINSDKIKTSPQPGPRNAWIGNPHHRNCVVEVGATVCPQKFTPKKTAIEKNSTVKNREFDSIFFTIEFFGLRIFSLGELLRENFC